MDEPWLKGRDLVIGTIYDVDIEDCCIQAQFTSRLVSITSYDDENDYPTLLFENGVTMDGYLGAHITEPRKG